MVAHFTCQTCHRGFVLVQGMELGDIATGDESGGSTGMSEDSLSTLATTRTSVSVIDFINSLEVHKQNCAGSVVYTGE